MLVLLKSILLVLAPGTRSGLLVTYAEESLRNLKLPPNIFKCKGSFLLAYHQLRFTNLIMFKNIKIKYIKGRISRICWLKIEIVHHKRVFYQDISLKSYLVYFPRGKKSSVIND